MLKHTVKKLVGEVLCLEFNGKIKLDDKRKDLDNKGWKDFCGSYDEKKIVPFCEKPECYMVVDYIKLYLQSEFLEYCSLNDTPGFGSITEEHDACTERFVSSNKSRLLVMIQIYSKTEDTKLYEFLNFISNVYSNYRKDQFDDVFFMLNCFSNNAGIEKLKKDSHKIAKYIVNLGFKKDNIYVCNLRESIEESIEQEKMFGFPSYVIFRENCIINMMESSLQKKYLCVYKQWSDFFDLNISNVNDQIRYLSQKISVAAGEKDNLENKRKVIMEICEPSIDDLLEKVKNEYEEIYDEIHSTFNASKRTKLKLFSKERERKSECCKIIDSYESRISDGFFVNYSYEIRNLIQNKITEIEVNSDCLSLGGEISEPDNVIFTISLEKIKEKLLDADEQAIWFNLKKEKIIDSAMREIKRIIDTDYNESERRAYSYFEKILVEFKKAKKDAKKFLNKKLEAIDNPELKQEQLEEYTILKKELNEYKRLLNKTVNIGKDTTFSEE